MNTLRTIFILSISILVFITCFNGGLGESDSTQKYPEKDFYGVLTDYQTQEDVHFLRISGKINAIEFYGVPSKLHKDLDPTRNKTHIDLHELKSIRAVNPNRPTAGQIEINGRKFVKVLLTFTTGKTKEYIIQSTRMLECVVIHKAEGKTVYQDRKLQLLHIKNLEITGYTSSQITMKQAAAQQSKHENEQQAILENFEKLHTEVQNLPEDNPSLLKKTKRVILDLLKTLRNQVQAILHSLSTSQ